MAGKFELYTAKAGEARFRLKALNGQVILVSEGYKKKSGAKNGIESVKKNAPGAPVDDQTAACHSGCQCSAADVQSMKFTRRWPGV